MVNVSPCQTTRGSICGNRSHTTVQASTCLKAHRDWVPVCCLRSRCSRPSGHRIYRVRRETSGHRVSASIEDKQYGGSNIPAFGSRGHHYIGGEQPPSAGFCTASVGGFFKKSARVEDV
eukprot:9466855-Pyramimonas_sp.AAC.1